MRCDLADTGDAEFGIVVNNAGIGVAPALEESPAEFGSTVYVNLTADIVGSERGANWIRRHTPIGQGGRAGELDGALPFSDA